MLRTLTIFSMLCVTFPAVAGADVIESTSAGFTIRTVVEIAATPRGGLEPVVRIIDQALAGQVQRLKRYIESGPLR